MPLKSSYTAHITTHFGVMLHLLKRHTSFKTTYQAVFGKENSISVLSRCHSHLDEINRKTTLCNGKHF